jgi:hypothetical protein
MTLVRTYALPTYYHAPPLGPTTNADSELEHFRLRFSGGFR